MQGCGSAAAGQGGLEAIVGVVAAAAVEVVVEPVVGCEIRFVAKTMFLSVGPAATTVKLDAARGNPVQCLAAATFVA